jgi:hypothetical protein
MRQGAFFFLESLSRPSCRPMGRSLTSPQPETDFSEPVDASEKVVAALKRPPHGSALMRHLVATGRVHQA